MTFAELVQAALLGTLEGLTEFLPVSSTGHLILAVDFFRVPLPPGKLFEVVIQLGAICAIVWLYRSRFWDVARHLRTDKNARHFVRNIGVALIPSLVIGALAHGFITEYLFSPRVVAVALIVGGIAILFIEAIKPNARFHDTEEFSVRTALAIGFCQALAMIPGISRSGATIMGALLLGADRKAAAEFSFFLAVPTMLAASVFSLYEGWGDLTAGGLELIIVGFVAAFISAALVVKPFVSFVSRYGFGAFAWYRIALGIIMLVLLSERL